MEPTMAESLLWLWFSFHSEVQHNYLGQICYLIGWDSSQKPHVIWNCYYKMFCWLKIQDGHHCRSRFNIGPYGNMIKKTFTEKFYKNDHWMHMVTWLVFIFCCCVDWKSKIAINNIHILTGPLWEKCFFFSKITDSRKLGRMYLVWCTDKFTFLCFNRKSSMSGTAGHN
jgi:hypothetical protein